jgi:hypothetical protein
VWLNELYEYHVTISSSKNRTSLAVGNLPVNAHFQKQTLIFYFQYHPINLPIFILFKQKNKLYTNLSCLTFCLNYSFMLLDVEENLSFWFSIWNFKMYNLVYKFCLMLIGIHTFSRMQVFHVLLWILLHISFDGYTGEFYLVVCKRRIAGY